MGRLPTCYSPVRHFTRRPKPPFSCDLHVLGPPLTFALSQDQTLHLEKFVLRRSLSGPASGLYEQILKLLSSLLFSFQRPTRGPKARAPPSKGTGLYQPAIRRSSGFFKKVSDREGCKS